MTRTFRKEVAETQALDDVRCNKCGESCMVDVTGDGRLRDFYGAQVGFSTGYFSSSLPDGVTYNFDLCERCLKSLMDSFVDPPRTQEWIG